MEVPQLQLPSGRKTIADFTTVVKDEAAQTHESGEQMRHNTRGEQGRRVVSEFEIGRRQELLLCDSKFVFQ